MFPGVHSPRPFVATAVCAVVIASACSRPPEVRPEAISSVFELRLVYRDSAADRDRYQYEGKVVYLARPPLLADHDVTVARAARLSSSELVLQIHFPSDVGARLMRGTDKHTGGRLAVIVDSRLSQIVHIAAPIGSGGRLSLNTGLSGLEAARIEQLVRAKWPNP